jgi:copper(I)-binding protein
MHHRSKLVLAVGALLLATPALSSCGFNLATDRVNTVQHGGTNRDGSVDVLAAVIVSGTTGSGTLSARLVNNTDEPAELVGVSSSGVPELTATAVEPTEIAAHGALALADVGDGVRLEGDFERGDVVDVVFELGSGERVDVEVPVVRECGFYDGLDSAPAASDEGAEGAEPTQGASDEAEAVSCETEEAEGH